MNPGQAARNVILRGFPREVIFTEPAIYDSNRYDAYVLQNGDQVTTVVIDGDADSATDVINGNTVINLRNDSILDRAACVPTRAGKLSLAAKFFRQLDPADKRTPACISVRQAKPAGRR